MGLHKRLQFTHRIQLHQLRCRELLCLAERFELDLWRRKGLIAEWALYCVQVMSTYGHQGAPPAQILMQLVLKIDEIFVTTLDLPGNKKRSENKTSDKKKICLIDINFTRL